MSNAKHLDRLSSLLSQFKISCARLASIEESNLFIFGKYNKAEKLNLYIDSEPPIALFSDVIAFAHVDIGGKNSPLNKAIPPVIEIKLDGESELKTITDLLILEVLEERCGGQFTVDRLCELVVVNILRDRISSDTFQTGMFAGLAHSKLRYAIVAMHDNPGKIWRVEDFADLTAMSRSQFMAEFQNIVGITPMVYLKRWRMTLARVDVLKGRRIKEIAFRFGYSSSEAFCRDFISIYGTAPSKMSNNIVHGSI